VGWGAVPGDAEQQALKRDICAYLPLVQRMVRQLARRLPANVQRDDLLAAGVCGLVDSLRRNGGDGGAGFAWYARTRIRGAIFDELRAQDWLPRRVRDRISGGEAPASFVSFDEVVHDDEGGLAGGDDPAELAEQSSERRALAEAIQRLPEREQTIVGRYYYDGARLKDIGAELGLSEPRISQILSRAVTRLRAILQAEAS
jgi:RNA polymerase sigma factor for flagellar operon FliA